MMTEEDKENLAFKIENEGFDYAMLYYSNWTDVQDGKFHMLRQTMKDARKALIDYLIENGIDDEVF